MHNTFIEIDSQQFVQNLQLIEDHINSNLKYSVGVDSSNGSKNRVLLCLPVKANAYGHGLVGIAKLAEPLVDYLAVACLSEGEILRKAGILKPILVFGAFTEDQIDGLISNNLDITISSMYKAQLVARLSKLKNFNFKCRVHIKVDTGMNRIGVRPDGAIELIDYVIQQDSLHLVGVYSHLATSDTPDSELTKIQISKFIPIVKYVKAIDEKIICHIANSGAVCFYPDSYLDMVRPGILAYGYKPNDSLGSAIPITLSKISPCYSLKSKIVYFKVVAKGQGISYNHTYITKEQTRVVTIPIGYGDGYRVMLSNIGEVIIRGKKYTVSGRVCMDMLMVDIGSNGEAYIDDEVVLIGKQGQEEITAISMSQKCNTIIYEIVCGFNERIPRVYTLCL